MKKITYKLLYSFGLMALLSTWGCNRETITDGELPAEEKRSFKYDATVATDWMNLINYLVKSEGRNPPQASRVFGYAGVTFYESCVPGMPQNRSLQGQLTGLSGIPKRNTKKAYDFREVSNEAIYLVVKGLFPTLKPANLVKVDSIHNAIAAQIQTEIAGPVFSNSQSFGAGIGGALVNWMNQDNFTQTRFMAYTVPSRSINPSFWEPTDAVNLTPAEPFWGLVRPFKVQPTNCYVPSNIPYSTDVNSAFYQQANEVFAYSSQTLTQEEKNIANWWADNAGSTYTPPGHWMKIATLMINQLDYNLAEAAELYALSGIASADAFIACWKCKYQVNLLRPKTYIRENMDPNWSSFIGTPPFPEYTSGHSVCSGAVSEVMTQYIGNQSFTDDVNTPINGIAPRTFSSFYEAADEAAMSRLYGGIHFREAIENGISQGRCLGQTLMNSIKLDK